MILEKHSFVQFSCSLGTYTRSTHTSDLIIVNILSDHLKLKGACAYHDINENIIWGIRNLNRKRYRVGNFFMISDPQFMDYILLNGRVAVFLSDIWPEILAIVKLGKSSL